MGIRRLKNHSTDEMKMPLLKDDGVLVLAFADSKFEFLYFDSSHEIDYLKLNRFSDALSFKYVGKIDIYKSIKKMNFSWFQNCDRKIFIKNDIEILFNVKEQKIKIPKGHGIQIPDEKKKVLIVDDSKTIHKILKRIISDSQVIEVMDVANNAEEAKAIIERERPDLITLDIHMPGMNGVEFLKSYLKNKNIPTMMISSVSFSEGPLVMEALSNGAIDYLEKPKLEDIATQSHIIREKIENISTFAYKKAVSLAQINSRFSHFDGVIAIGSSTGGTKALQDILQMMPDEIPPIVITQHIPSVFSKALADRFNSLFKFTVSEGVDGEKLEKNHVYIAPGGRHMKIRNKSGSLVINITDEDPYNRFRPSVDLMMYSLEECKVDNLIGVILTGMGRDGADGLLRLKKQGHFTLGQDEESCVVYGMPREAYEIGAIEQVSSLCDMAENICQAFNKTKKAKSA